MISFKKKLGNKAFSHVELLLLLVVVIGVSGIGYYIDKYNTSHASNTYTQLSPISFDGQTFSEEACITTRSGTAPNYIETVTALVSVGTAAGPSTATGGSQTTSVSSSPAVVSALAAVNAAKPVLAVAQSTLASDQSALATANATLASDKVIAKNNPNNAADQAAVTALTDRVNTDSAAVTALSERVATDTTTVNNDTAAYNAAVVAAEKSTTSSSSGFNPMVFYDVNNGGSPTEDNWATGPTSTISFNLPPTAANLSFRLGVEASNSTSDGLGSSQTIGSLTLCSPTGGGSNTGIGGTTTSSPIPADYTSLGTATASSLYNVKVPPATSDQPNMTIYACVVNSKVPEVQFIGVLSYSVPQALSTNWYAILDISSSATADSPINDKGVSYDFKNNSWVNNEGVSGTVNEATVASSGQLSYPTATTDFYVWAYGSYGGATLTPINDHPNITQLATCASNTSTGYSTIQGSTTVSTGSGTTSHGVTATGSATHAINTTTNKKPTPRGIDRLYRDFLNLF